jgi:hypothetical protein
MTAIRKNVPAPRGERPLIWATNGRASGSGGADGLHEGWIVSEADAAMCRS